ncbi:MAG: hypothetical protein L0332_12210 [Chloroflexi bacterium]|nr:hypothetical protein [Chloroflexota bacterium]MCI0579559.1 hypothetical protein [Chloroflexota bacterium]MCI0646800.1 hypothetical protein [Chloroflexota bacterium]MCI0727470.1 hypothetical protein [Chloroflexota bacterium]
MNNLSVSDGYHRYHIETKTAPDIVAWPSRFKVKVSRVGLARLLLSELIHYRGDVEVMLSRPCLYGVFSGPVGGFMPRSEKCVGCLRCTTQYPEWVRVEPNPERQRLGDSYFTFRHVNAVAYEAESGRIPVKGAGYRGRFGGEGWDGMWTDMSEIVRPTRDGIHGREFISTVVDIGSRLNFLVFDERGEAAGKTPQTFTIPLPLLFDAPAPAVATPTLYRVMAEAAGEIGSLAILPVEAILANQLRGPHLAPLFTPAEARRLISLPFKPKMVVMDGWDEQLYEAISRTMAGVTVCLRLDFTAGEELLRYAEAGVRVFHLTANYHGRGRDGAFVFDLIRAAHKTFVQAGRRDEVTLLGSGGVVAAEHVPKAIIAGLDAVALDTPLLVALQARFNGEFTHRHDDHCQLPAGLDVAWGVQRLKNLTAAWRDQLLEVMGAMGLREVRRLRGEIGRAMFQKDLEREAFAGIEGYGS